MAPLNRPASARRPVAPADTYRRQAPTSLIPPQPYPAPGTLIDVYPSNFGLLNSDASWRTTWATIVSGRFTDSPFSSLLFVEDSTAYAELYDTNGQGALQTPLRGKFNPLGRRTTWTHIVPGYFGPSGFTGLPLYDQAAGFGQFYDSDGKGGFVLLSEYSGWRTTWSHIVYGRFVDSSPYSGLFFYSPSENYGEVWTTDECNGWRWDRGAGVQIRLRVARRFIRAGSNV